jgi:hypothetical protein
MRLSFIGLVAIVLTLVAPALSSASQSGNMKSSYRYDACICHFGYPGSSCVPAVACDSEGGRCEDSCFLPPEGEYSRPNG